MEMGLSGAGLSNPHSIRCIPQEVKAKVEMLVRAQVRQVR